MKKLLSLAIVAAALGASVGCEDKKTSAPVKPAGAGSGSAAGSSSSSGSH
jgi:hypothetical protein